MSRVRQLTTRGGREASAFTRRRAWLAPLLIALVTAPVAASDDAGTQSVFATGAGNRASAMGGAFVAAVDDASALVWNPAGLGCMSRLELQGMQSGDLGLGMSESYAALALPSWRWGAAGLSLRTFGANGIDRRDARNVRLGDDFDDRQIELALGYGRAFDAGVSIGGAVKLQHQTLAGFSGSGLGLDLGATVSPAALGVRASWAEGLSFGMALRNAVEPALRLDRESVPDPMSLRAGVAWRTLTPAGSLLTELDVDHARDVAPRIHAGLEVRLFDAAALRVGLSDRVLTAGTGVRYHDIGIDYVFENAPLGPAHRAGVTLRFGSTTDESRTAWRRREDEKVERRLADAFRRRQSEQVADLMRRATEARTRGDFDAALESLALIATLEPGRADASRLELVCLSDEARKFEAGSDYSDAALVWERALRRVPGDSTATSGVQRCRAESDRLARRNADARAAFSAAMDAFAADDLARAREEFGAALKLAPDDADAQRMASRTEQAIARRAESLVAQAMRAIRAGSLDEADAAIAQARALDRDAVGLEPATLALARAREAVTSPAHRADATANALHPPTPAPAAPRLGDREVEDLYSHGLAALRAGRGEDALRYWELVWSARPDYREVAGYLKREYLTRGMEAFAAGRLDDAMSQWERVLRIDPTDERARGYLARAQEQRTRSREILGGGP